MGSWSGLLLNPPGFDVNFLIVGIDVIYAAFRAHPIGSAFLCPQGAGGGVFAGGHSGTQGRIFRKKWFVDALGQTEEDGNEGCREDERALHEGVIIFSGSVICQVPELD